MIPYLGNKSSLSDFLKQYVPKNPTKWVEPFGGGFNLFFTLDLKQYPDTEFYYNDINPLNCILFEHLKNDDFIKLIKSTNVTRELFEESYDNLIDKPVKKSKKKVILVDNSEEKALSWLIILCCGDIKDIMNKDFKGNSTFEILKYKLSHYSEYFKRIKISNIDYKEVLKQLDSENTFFYLDPPYVGFENYYINNTFKGESHNELSNELKKLKGKWLLSYYKFDKLEEWYSNYKVVSKRHNLSEEFLILSV
jgi:DNA adenine methylase